MQLLISISFSEIICSAFSSYCSNRSIPPSATLHPGLCTHLWMGHGQISCGFKHYVSQQESQTQILALSPWFFKWELVKLPIVGFINYIKTSVWCTLIRWALPPNQIMWAGWFISSWWWDKGRKDLCSRFRAQPNAPGPAWSQLNPPEWAYFPQRESQDGYTQDGLGSMHRKGWDPLSGCYRDDVAGMLKAGRERREVGFPARSKDPLARQHSSLGKISYQRGLVLLARVSGQPVIQAPAYLEVPEGLFMGLKLTGVYALLDWACWGGLHPPPTCQQGRAPAFLQSNGQTPGILKHHWSITQIKPK